MIYKDDVTKCDQCWTHHKAHPELERACVQLGKIKHKPPVDILAGYLRAYHRDGHK